MVICMKEQNLYDFKDPRINSIIFNVTFSCNLGCDYCYFEKGKKSKTGNMDLNIVKRIITSYARFIDEHKSNYQNMYLVWHGGEPLLGGKKYFREIVKIEKEFIQNGYKIFNAIQTNGTLIDEDWISFFRENNFQVGISLDGPKEINDIHRHYIDGKSYFDITYSNIKLLIKNKIPVSVIAVITKNSVKNCQKIFNFFDELGISSIDFIPCFLYDNEVTLDSESYSKFLLEMFDFCESSPNTKLKIRFLNDIKKKIKWLEEQKGTLYTGCELSGRCGENISIFPNGDIYLCDTLTPIDRLKIGNIKDMDLSQIHKTDKFEEFKKNFNDINPECFSCEVFDICKGGCLNRRLPEFNYDKKDFYCNARKDIIKHIMKKLE